MRLYLDCTLSDPVEQFHVPVSLGHSNFRSVRSFSNESTKGIEFEWESKFPFLLSGKIFTQRWMESYFNNSIREKGVNWVIKR